MALVFLGVSLFGQTGESLADKVSFELEFSASVLSADSEGVVDSMANTGFGDNTKLGVNYDSELWGVSAALKFTDLSYRIFFKEGYESDPLLSVDELYAWGKPFGEHFKFTGGIFSNTDGVNDYTDDIDIYGMGRFSTAKKVNFTPKRTSGLIPLSPAAFLPMLHSVP